MLNAMLDAALRAPDHGGLHPWRLIEFADDARAALADLFEAEKRRRDPVATRDDLARAREHATHAPKVLAFIVCIYRHPLVPQHEQWLSAGAALGNLLMAAHLMGLGAIVLSGERCQDDALREALGVATGEVLAGFISIGTIGKAPPPVSAIDRKVIYSEWKAAVASPTAVHLNQSQSASSNARQVVDRRPLPGRIVDRHTDDASVGNPVRATIRSA